MKLLRTLFPISKKNWLSCLLLISLFSVQSYAQELNWYVIVNSDQVQTQEKAIFDDLQRTIQDFLDNQIWTEDEFAPEERIDCNLVIQVTGVSNPALGGRFTTTAQIQSSRPIYGVNSVTTMFNFADKKFDFDYLINKEFNYSSNSYTGNLPALLAFYSYMILGYDYDSFSELGGKKYFEKARETMLNAQQGGFGGWEAQGDINDRYWLIDNMINIQFEPFRKASYTYHRLILDNFSDPEKQRKAQADIIKILLDIEKIRKLVPTSIVLNTFFFSKGDEFVRIFKGADQEMKMSGYNMLKKVDPSNADVYQRILK